MNRETLLGLYDRLTGLVEKLPGGLQKPILKELVPIRELFLEQRAARLLLVGDTGPSVEAFLAGLLPPPVAPVALRLVDLARRHEDLRELRGRRRVETAERPGLGLQRLQLRLPRHRQPRERGARGHAVRIDVPEDAREAGRVRLGVRDLFRQALEEVALADRRIAGLERVEEVGHVDRAPA